MANETITGCVNWTTGQVEFDQDSCTYNGCIIWTGVHAGQVAVTVSTDCCDDTYYGCVDWTTGNFEVILPDYCCECPVNDCPCIGDSGWQDFLDAGFQPKYISLTNSVTYCDGEYVSGSTKHIWSGFSVLNDTFTLTHYGGCTYRYTDDCNITQEIYGWNDYYDRWDHVRTYTHNKFRVNLILNDSSNDNAHMTIQLSRDGGSSWSYAYVNQRGTFSVNASTGHVTGSLSESQSLICSPGSGGYDNRVGSGSSSFSSSDNTDVCEANYP